MKSRRTDRAAVTAESLKNLREARNQKSSSGLAPWLLGGGTIVGVFGALMFGATKYQEAENLRTQLDNEREVSASLKKSLSTDGEARAALAMQAGGAEPGDTVTLPVEELDALREEIDRARLERDEAQQLWVSASEKLNEAETRRQDGGDADSEALLTRARGELETLAANNAMLEQQLQEAFDELAQLRQRVDDQQRQLAELTDQRERLRAELDTQQDRRPETDQTVAKLRAELQAAKFQADNATQVVDQVARRLKVNFDRQDWAKPAPDGRRPIGDRLLAKLDQQLTQPPVKQSGDPASYSDAVQPGKRLLTRMAELAPKRGPHPLFAPGEVKLHEVHFSSGSINLSPGGLRKAEQVAALFQAEPIDRIRVLGFSDTVGGSGVNQRISERRAGAVAEALVAAGVPRDRIEILGSGEENLPVPTADGTSEPLNRCVAILATPAGA